MKKSTKIILPALALLVLGTTAAATSTVAWFAANGTVKATGMQVQCQTSNNLIISNTLPANLTAQAGQGAAYGSSVATRTTGMKTLTPSSTTESQLTNAEGSFYYVDGSLDDTNIDAVSGKVGAGSKITKVTGGETSTYYVRHDFWLANSSKDAMDIVISDFTVTDNDDSAVPNAEISKALRIAIVYQDRSTNNDGVDWKNTYHVVNGATNNYQGFSKEGVIRTLSTGPTVAYKDSESNDMSEQVQTSIYTSKESEDVSMGKIKPTTTTVTSVADYQWSKLAVYVWYEGQDDNCTSNNAMSIEKLTISLEFTATAAVPTPAA